MKSSYDRWKNSLSFRLGKLEAERRKLEAGQKPNRKNPRRSQKNSKAPKTISPAS
jgi:hypothetical protein